MFKYNIGNATHVGQVRKANEDYFGNFQTPNGHVFVVCDGMGGHVGGAKASRIAVESIKSFLSSNEFSDPKLAIHHSIVNANTSIIKFAEQNIELKGMGATCVLMLISEKGVFIGHVGDSRIYHYADSKLIRLTKDHSFVQTLVDMGEISESEAERHPRKNEISNALGLPNMKPPTIRDESISVHKNDIVLLCTDGLTGIVNDKGIAQVLRTNKSIQAKADILVESANQGGGNDNITVQLIEFTEAPTVYPSSLRHKRIVKKLITISIIALLLVMGAYVGKHFWLKPNLNNKTIPVLQTNDSLNSNSEIYLKDNGNNESYDSPTDYRNSKGSETPLGLPQDAAKSKSASSTSLVNPKTNKTNTPKKLELKPIGIKITDYKDTTILLKQIIDKSDFVDIDNVALWYKPLDKSNLVDLVYDNKLKTIQLVPNLSKNGKTIYEICLVDQKEMVSLSDTVKMTIETIPIIDLKEYTIMVNKKENRKVAVKSIIASNKIIGYNKDVLSVKLHNAPDWVHLRNDTIFLNAHKNPNSSFKYEIFNGETSIGLNVFHVKLADN